MKIIPLSEGSFTIDASKQFVPFNEEDVLTDRNRGSLLVEIQPFVVITSRDVILLDTGLGFHDRVGSEMQLLNNLKSAGIDPSSITKVLMTHLHKDHAGGVSLDEDRRRLSLPIANYYVQERELNYAMEKGSPSFIPEELEALRHSDQVVLLKEDEGTIDGYIRYMHTGAHSQHHQVFWIEEDNEIIFFGGDDAPQFQQMKVKYKTKYDFDPQKASDFRQKWWDEGTGWTFLFYHDIKTPFFKK